MVIFILGVLVPAEISAELTGTTVLLLYGILGPMFFSLVICADFFAGERERETLDTLLALPISRWNLFLGKTFAASFLSTICVWATIVVFSVLKAFVLSTSLTHEGTALFGTMVLSILAAIGASTLGNLISWGSTDVRTAQTTAMLPFLFAAVGLPFFILHVLPKEWLQAIGSSPTNEFIFYTVLSVIVFDGIVGGVARRMFPS